MRLPAALFALSLVAAWPAAAQERSREETPAVPSAPPAASARPATLADTDLAAARGGQTIIVSNQSFQAANTGSSIGDYSAGAITLSDNALSGFNGIGNFVINTGAQNNLQAGMTLTINLSN